MAVLAACGPTPSPTVAPMDDSDPVSVLPPEEPRVVKIDASMGIDGLVDELRGGSLAVCLFVHAPGIEGGGGEPVVLEADGTTIEGSVACGRDGLAPFSKQLAAHMPVIYGMLQGPPPEGEMFGGELFAVELGFGPRGRMNNGGGITGGSPIKAHEWVSRLADDEHPVALVTWPDELDEPDPLLDLVSDRLQAVKRPKYDDAIVAAVRTVFPQLGQCTSRGAATLHFDVSAEGNLDNVVVLVDDMPDEAAACVRDTVERVRIELPEGAEPTRAYLPIVIGNQD